MEPTCDSFDPKGIVFCNSKQELLVALGSLMVSEPGDYSGVFVLVDENTRNCCLPVIDGFSPESRTDIIEIASGERNKNMDACFLIWNELLTRHADRKSLLISLGGGMISDIGGFAASVFKRGIRFVHIPTTLLGMVDAAIGGKTGVNFGGYKNQIGLFSFPQKVLVYPGFLSTLPENHLRSGFAEIVKYGLIADAALWNKLQTCDPTHVITNPDIIKRCIEIKLEITGRDPYEKSERKMLNFGHTVGHAFESLSLSGEEFPLLHGEAVAAGMICEAYLSTVKTGLSKDHLSQITTFLSGIFPACPIGEDKKEGLLKIMRADKKNEYGAFLLPLIAEPGVCIVDKLVKEKELMASLDYYLEVSRGK